MRGLPRGLSPALSLTSDARAREVCRRRSPPGDTVSGGACATPVRTGKLVAYEPRHCAIPASGSRRRAVRNPPLYAASRAAPPNGASRPEPANGSAQFHANEVPTLGDAHGRRSDDHHREDHGVQRPRHGSAYRSAYRTAHEAEVAARHSTQGCALRKTGCPTNCDGQDSVAKVSGPRLTGQRSRSLRCRSAGSIRRCAPTPRQRTACPSARR